MMKTILLATALAVTAPAFAQTTSTPAKKELIGKILNVQQPAIETLARQLVEQPAALMLQRAGQYIQARVPAEKREAMGREIQADARKYVDETLPVVRDRAIKLAPTTLGAVMEDRLTEDELRQVLAIFESATWQKFQSLGPEMQKSLSEQLVADVKDKVEPKVRALDQTITKRLGLPVPAASAPTKGK